jgi:pyruvate formate lyase activating enzyme
MLSDISRNNATQHRSVSESRLYQKVDKDNVRCLLCHRNCIIAENRVGFCKTRKNIGGRLYTLVYGDISSISVNPIEKKPFYHFHPGSEALTVGTWSCNFTCPWCQNFMLSKVEPDPTRAVHIPPEELVRKACVLRCKGTSFSFNEPTLLFEYALDVFPLAHKRGLYNTYVSNGYMTREALEALAAAGLDAIKFDIKGTSDVVKKYCGADIEHIWDNVRLARELGLHIELVNLIIPGLNDGENMLKEVIRNALNYGGEYTPLHFTRFFPSYKLIDREPTPISTLERAYELAKRVGLKYVYLGNVPGHQYESTYCHNCGTLLIDRAGFEIFKYNLNKGRCLKCNTKIPIVQ